MLITWLRLRLAQKDLPQADQILALKGNAENGKNAMARCYVCHKIGSVGVEFGPTLEGWGTGQDRKTILKAITNPSDDLAHGYEGTEIIVRGNKRIKDLFRQKVTLVIRVFGGEDLVIAERDIIKRKTMKTSLMAPASRLGLMPRICVMWWSI